MRREISVCKGPEAGVLSLKEEQQQASVARADGERDGQEMMSEGQQGCLG